MKTEPSLSLLPAVPLLIAVRALCGLPAAGPANTGPMPEGVKAIYELTYASSQYRREALRLVTAEANEVARNLGLAESLPIGATDVLASYITPPRLADRIGSVGNVATANYTYFVSVDKKFSFLARNGLQQDYASMRKQWSLSSPQMDTNAAYQMAAEWLSRASMDVPALNRDCQVSVLAFTPEGQNGQHFVPLYWVYWTRVARGTRTIVASVELFAPTRTLRQLRVEDSKYILRRRLLVQIPERNRVGPEPATNRVPLKASSDPPARQPRRWPRPGPHAPRDRVDRACLVKPTASPLNSRPRNLAPSTPLPTPAGGPTAASEPGANEILAHRDIAFTTPAYQREALRLLLREANAVAEQLRLPEKRPITEKELASCYISPPRMARGRKALGNVETTNYFYGVSVGNRFSSLVRIGFEADRQRLRAQYLWPIDRVDTNAAYQAAARVLTALSMDVASLDHDCNLEIRPFVPLGTDGKHFVPLYFLRWTKAGNLVAMVEILEPTQRIDQLYIEDARYILRQPLKVENLEQLLSGSTPKRTNSPPAK